ncbi:MAG TPA: ribonuclease HII [Clostridiales bacterium]|nr:ribonuclease HII [Clostridiales bacterium]
MDFRQLSYKQITSIINQNIEHDSSIIAKLMADDRKNVRALGLRLQKRLNRDKLELERLRSLWRYEQQAIDHGYGYIVGVDEAGRGPLAGPVVAAAVVLKDYADIKGIDDSKKISPLKRERLYDDIINKAVSYGIGIVHPYEIDETNILMATKKAMITAIQAIKAKVHEVKAEACCILVDAVDLQLEGAVIKPIVKGDQKSLSIAAASILAKVTRDRIMQEFHNKFPQYRFDKNKGYGTKEHITAIKNHGLCPIHRRTFIKVPI